MNATESGKRPGLVVLIASVAAVGGFLFGYDLSIISGAMLYVEPEFGLTQAEVGFAVGSALLGCMAGPLLGGALSDRWGRKPTLIFAGMLFATGSIGSAMPANVIEFDMFRFLGGVGVGLASVVSPMFIAEVSPPRIRGALVTVNQLAIVVGLACAVVVSYYLSFGKHWGWMLASNAAPVPFFVVGLLLVPESPRWMAQKNRRQEAIDVLTLIDGRQHAESEMQEIAASAKEEGGWRELWRPGMRFAMLIACSLAVFQQITGASILTMYMPKVFKEAGYPTSSDAIRLNVIMSIWYIFCTVVALMGVDRLGRKPLLLLGTLGMTAGMVIVGALFHRHAPGMYVVLAMALVMGAYLVSLAPLTWLIMSEIFPNRLRGKAMGVASVCVWTASFAAAFCFPPLAEYFKIHLGTPAMAFWIYAIISAAAFLFALIVVPETKGRTLEELGASWNKTPQTH
ncbi:MAG: sugar porter family MFS transporter [Thermoguttaceae bacterium]